MLVMTLIPIGDAVVVLRSGGSKATAYGVHVATAVVMAVIGILLLALDARRSCCELLSAGIYAPALARVLIVLIPFR